MDTWVNQGIGVDCEEIVPYLSIEKVRAILTNNYPDDFSDVNTGEMAREAIIDLYRGGIAEMLADLDENNLVTWGTDSGRTDGFLLYPPSYPWEQTENDPKSQEEARELIKRLVRQVCDISEVILDNLVQEFYEIASM